MKHQRPHAELKVVAVFPIILFLLFLFGTSPQGVSQTAPTSNACKSTVTGDLDIVPLTSAVYGNTRNLRVWLPPGYHDPANTKTYPVLYLFDAQLLFDRCTAPGQIGEVQVDEALTDLIGRHAIEPIIVVAIDNAGAQRMHEYAPYSNPTLPADDPSPLEGKRIPEFLAKDVLPFVASHYRVTKGREHTGVGGYSLGAVAALTSLLERPDLFGLGLLESTSLQLGNGRLIRETAPILEGPIRIAIGVGTAELGPNVSKQIGVPDFDSGFVQLSRTLAANFKAAFFTHTEVKLTVQPGASHNPQFWSERFPAAVQFLYPPAR